MEKVKGFLENRKTECTKNIKCLPILERGYSKRLIVRKERRYEGSLEENSRPRCIVKNKIFLSLKLNRTKISVP